MSKQYLDLEIKSFDTDGEQGTFIAYANVKSVVDRVRDVTVDGCFKWNPNKLPKMLYQHDHTKVIGVWLEIEEDSYGLRVKGKLALGTTLGAEVYELMKLGAIDALSIGYITEKERYDPSTRINYLESIFLHEISIVTFPCNQESLIDSVKSGEVEIQEEQTTNDAEKVIEEVERIETTSEQKSEEGSIEETSEDVAEVNLLEVVEQKLDNFLLNQKLNSFLRSL